MKPGTLIVKIVTWILMLGAIAYFAVYASRVVFRDYATATLYTFSAEDTIETTGYMVREETPLEGGSDLLEATVAEGETVASGDNLAVVYEDEDALNRHLEIQDLESRLESLQYILSHSADATDSATLNGSIVTAMEELHTAVASGDLSELSSQTDQLKTLLFRREYTYNGSSTLTQEIKDVAAQIEELSQENRSHATAITATQSGAFSSMVDGYEAALTPEAIRDLTPAKLEELLAKREEVPENAYVGKLITDSTWYFATELSEDEAERMKIGDTLTLRFNSLTRTIEMNVDSISRADENGTVCVVFSSDKYLSETTLLRDQTADIVFDTVTGFRVDKSAVHVDNESGDIGIYRVYGTQAKWVSVEILWDGDDYYLVSQKPEYDEDGNQVENSELDQARQLRDGAEVLIRGTNLYDGKVLS